MTIYKIVTLFHVAAANNRLF